MNDDSLAGIPSGVVLCSWLDHVPPVAPRSAQVDAAEVWLSVDFEAEDDWTGEGEPALGPVGPILDLDWLGGAEWEETIDGLEPLG